MHTLIIYDNTGRIWGLHSYDEDVAPAGLQSIVCDVPEGYHIYGVDVENKKPLYEKDEDPVGDINTAIDDIMAIILNS